LVCGYLRVMAARTDRIELSLAVGAERSEDTTPEAGRLVGFVVVEVRDAGSQWWAAPHLEVLDHGIDLDELLGVAVRSLRDDLLPAVLEDPSDPIPPPIPSWWRWPGFLAWASSDGRSSP